MPKRPILSRTSFFTELPGPGHDNGVALVNCNMVDTELGIMVEPRNVSQINGTDKVVQFDAYDAAATRFAQIDEGAFYQQNGTWIDQVPRDFTL